MGKKRTEAERMEFQKRLYEKLEEDFGDVYGLISTKKSSDENQAV